MPGHLAANPVTGSTGGNAGIGARSASHRSTGLHPSLR
jgi:hypothetical protein